MNRLKKFLARCAGGTEKEPRKYAVELGWVVITLSLLFTFFIGIEIIQYIDNLDTDLLHRSSQLNKLPGDDGSNFTATDTTTVDSTIPPIRVTEDNFQARKFLSNYPFVVGIPLSLILGAMFFLLLRLFVSIKDVYLKFQRFLWWCAGARIAFLEESPADQPKYFGIGGTVFFTAMMATFAGGYAFFTAFDNMLLSIVFGLFWGALIFNLDRYIVSSTGKGDGTAKITWEEFWSALPRLALAILIAFVVATPLELKIFEKEINIEIQKIIDEKRQELAKGQDYNLGEIQLIKDEIARLKSEEDRLKKSIRNDPRIDIQEEALTELTPSEKAISDKIISTRNQLNKYRSDLSNIDRQVANLDIDASGSERRRLEYQQNSLRRRINSNQGIVNDLLRQLREVNAKINTAENEIKAVQDGNSQSYAAVLAQNRNQIEKLNEQLANIQNIRRGEIVRYEEIAKQYTGLMAQLDALHRLTHRKVTRYATQSENKGTLKGQVSNASSDSLNSENMDTNEEVGLLPRQEPQIVEFYEEKTPVYYAKWLITLLFICIEIAPILFKMMTEAGPYDDRLAEEKHMSDLKMKKYISDENEKINLELKIKARKNQVKLEEEVNAHKVLLSYIAQAQNELTKMAIDEWRIQQLEKLSQNPESFIKTQTNDEGQNSVS